MALNVVDLLKPHVREAEKISAAWNNAFDEDRVAPEAVLLAAVVECIAACEKLNWRPTVFFARLAIDGDVLLDGGKDYAEPAPKVDPYKPSIRQVRHEPEVAARLTGRSDGGTDK